MTNPQRINLLNTKDKDGKTRNGSFDQGHYPPPPNMGLSGALPNVWELEWFYNGETIGPTGTPTQAPELIAVEWPFQFPEKKFIHGPSKDEGGDDWVLNCFRPAANGYGFKMVIKDMPASRYQFAAPVFPDNWHKISRHDWESKWTQSEREQEEHKDLPGNTEVLVRPGPHTSDDWYLASECYAYLSANTAALFPDRTFAGWLDARFVPFGKYTELTHIFDHPGGSLVLRFGARSPWPMVRSGQWWDDLQLYRIDELPPIPPPPPVPDPNQPPDTPPTPPNGHDPDPSIEELMAEVEALRTEVVGLRDAVMRAKKLTFFVFIGDEDKLNIHKSRTLSEAMALGLETHTFGEGA